SQVRLRGLDEAGPLILGTVDAKAVPGDPALTLAVPSGALQIPKEQLTAWVSAVAESNRRFWGGSPTGGGVVRLTPSPRGGVPFGRVLSLGGAVVTVLVGTQATPQD